MITVEEQLGDLHRRIKKLEQSQVKIGSGTLSGANPSTQTGSITLPDGTIVANVGVIGNYIPETGQQVHFILNGSQPIIYPPTAPIVSAPPAQVTGVVVTPGIGSLTIRWASIIEADVKWNRGYYQVQVDTVNTFNSGNLKSVDEPANVSVITGLATGTTYYVRVRAIDYVGTVGTYSATVTGVPITIVGADVNLAIGGGNFLPNSSFENSAGFAINWSMDPTYVTWAADTSDFRYGTKAARFTVNTGGGGFGGNTDHYGRAQQTVSVNNYEGPWVLSAWIKAPAGRGIGVSAWRAYNIAGVPTYTWVAGFPGDGNIGAFINVTATGVWQRVILPIPADTSTSATMEWNIRAGADGTWANGEQCRIDGVQFEVGEVATAYAPKPGEILPDTITNVELYPGTITDVELANNAVINSKILDGAITVTKVGDDQISTPKLQANSVTTAKINAGAVSAEKLSVTNLGDSVVLNPGFEQVDSADATLPARWSRRGGYYTSGYNAVKTNANSRSGDGAALFYGAPGLSCALFSDQVPVSEGDVWYVSVWAQIQNVFYDDFNSPDSTTSLGNMDYPAAIPWISNNGTWGINSNRAYIATNQGDSQNTIVAETGQKDGTIDCQLGVVGNGGICWRSTDNNNYWITNYNAGVLTAYKRVGGTYTVAGTWTGTINNGDTIRVVFSGATHWVYVNGTQRITWNDSFNQTATKHGMYAFSTGTVRFENWVLYGTGTIQQMFVRLIGGTTNTGTTEVQSIGGTLESVAVIENAYTKYEGQFTIPAGMRWAGVFLLQNGSNTGQTLLVDDVQMQKVVVSASIKDGAITTPKILAGAVTTEKLTVASLGDSVVLNPSFEEVSDADSTIAGQWSRAYSAWGTNTTANTFRNAAPGAGNVRSGSCVHQLFPGAGNASTVHGASRIPVVPGEIWYFAFWALAVGTNAGTSPGFYASLDSGASTIIGDTAIDGTGHNPTLWANMVVPTTWTKYETQVTIPAGRYWAEPYFLLFTTNTGVRILIDDVVLQKVTTSAVIQDGAITTPKLVAGAVTANKIAANTITAAQIAAHVITANEILAGTITTNEIAANTIVAGDIAANTLTAAEIAADAITASELAALNLAVGKYIRSTTYVAGSSGWSIDAAGNAEFNNVIVRGTVDSSYIKASTFSGILGANLIANPGAEVNTTGWTGNNCTLSRQTTTVRTGSGVFRLAATAGGDMDMRSPSGTSGFPVQPGTNYSATAYIRSIATSRAVGVWIFVYNAAGTFINSYATLGSNDSTNFFKSVQCTSGPMPATAAFAEVRVVVYAAAASEQHHVDDISFYPSSTIITDISTGEDGTPRVDISGNAFPIVELYGGHTIGEQPGQLLLAEVFSGNSLDAQVARLASGYLSGGTAAWLDLISNGTVSGITAYARLTANRLYMNDGADIPVVVHTDCTTTNPTATRQNSSTTYVECSAAGVDTCRVSSFKKRYAETTLLVRIAVTGITSITGIGERAVFGVYDGSAVTEVARVACITGQANYTAIAEKKLTGYAAGTYNFQTHWKSNSGQTLQINTDTTISLSITEVAA